MTKTNSIIDLHKAFNTSEEIVFKLIRKATGQRPIYRNKIEKGYDNEVYEIETIEGSFFVIKINHTEKNLLMTEQWAIEQVRSVGVPVSRICNVDKFNYKGKSLEYMVLEMLPGKSIADVKETLSEEQLSTAYRNIGKILRLIHSVSVGGFSMHHDDGGWDYDSYDQSINSVITQISSNKNLFQKNGFTSEEFEEMVGHIEQLRDRFDCKLPVLCHGDFLEEHLFIDEEMSITGVIDFGMCRGDHPIFDFARMHADSRFNNTEDIIEGYGEHDMFQDDFNNRLFITSLSDQMQTLLMYESLGLKNEVKRVADRLCKLFRSNQSEDVLLGENPDEIRSHRG